MHNSLFATPPESAFWRFVDAYEGHEAVHITEKNNAVIIDGTSLGIEGRYPWCLHYRIVTTKNWNLLTATIVDYQKNTIELMTDGAGLWTVNGIHLPALDGCIDIDLEASVVTNTLAVHRLSLQIDETGESSAVYIRTKDLKIERFYQTYHRLENDNQMLIFDYQAQRFGYHDKLKFSPDGLLINYPGIGERVSF